MKGKTREEIDSNLPPHDLVAVRYQKYALPYLYPSRYIAMYRKCAVISQRHTLALHSQAGQTHVVPLREDSFFPAQRYVFPVEDTAPHHPNSLHFSIGIFFFPFLFPFLLSISFLNLISPQSYLILIFVCYPFSPLVSINAIHFLECFPFPNYFLSFILISKHLSLISLAMPN